jgi:hypothetical protein
MIPHFNRAIQLSTWWLPQISGYSYLGVMAIRIDVHPTGETPTNMPRTLPTPVDAFCGQSPFVTTFHWLPWNRNRPLHLEEVFATKDRLAQTLSWVTSFLLPCDSPRVGERGFDPMVIQLVSEPYEYNTILMTIFSKTYGEDMLRCPYKDYSSLNKWQANMDLLSVFTFCNLPFCNNAPTPR